MIFGRRRRRCCRRQRTSGRLLDHVVFPVFLGHLEFGHRPAPHRLLRPGGCCSGRPRSADASRTGGLPSCKQLVGAGLRQPVGDLRQGLRATAARIPARYCWRLSYCVQRQVSPSSRRQATRVKATSPVSSYSSLFRQHLPQPSHSASHSVGRHLCQRDGFPEAGAQGHGGAVPRIVAGAGAVGVHLGDEGGQAVELQLGAQVIDKGDRQVLAVKIALEIEEGRFQGWAWFTPNIGRTPRLAAPM